ncbi:class I SAM-dependent methyltransferase [Xanthobacter autotrophicus]|uniref:class I SAM-dependent methyltransferase n=1 Tax=Xanthobacter TaxID=279 RepID=UPI0024AC07EB|nr:class I SAM-dependent methyltransferase [Xanthobacter autotrophicus]MDI4665718.1 class I SAM-dependent methyltransferase [Xanthobacter autotrophicus]
MTLNETGNLSRYLDDRYISANADWHQDDSAWKFAHILKILERNAVRPASLCEVGCGAGGIVDLMARHLPEAVVEGYEISPHAFALCRNRHAPNLSFTQGSPFDGARHFDLCMAIDVIEHVEDPFAFARSMGRVSTYQVLHIPLDMNALAVARGWVIEDARTHIGHLHYFTKATALSLLDECGLEVVDHFYTPWAIDQAGKTFKKRLAAFPRRIAFRVAPDAIVRLVGGWSLMVLTRTRAASS